jgi:hypothetical protein
MKRMNIITFLCRGAGGSCVSFPHAPRVGECFVLPFAGLKGRLDVLHHASHCVVAIVTYFSSCHFSRFIVKGNCLRDSVQQSSASQTSEPLYSAI